MANQAKDDESLHKKLEKYWIIDKFSPDETNVPFFNEKTNTLFSNYFNIFHKVKNISFYGSV